MRIFQMRLLGASAVFLGVFSLAACSSAASQPTAASTAPVATSSADGSAPPSSASAGPSPSSQQAQVSAQDDGSYYIFEEQAGGSWTAHAEGMAGIAGGTCSVQIPPALVALWRWPAGACHPAGV
jgi:hypothetical protein